MKRTFEWDGLDPLSFTSMLNIESNVKTLKIVICPILNTHLALKCMLMGVKAKKVFSLECCLSFKQLIFNRDIDNF